MMRITSTKSFAQEAFLFFEEMTDEESSLSLEITNFLITYSDYETNKDRKIETFSFSPIYFTYNVFRGGIYEA